MIQADKNKQTEDSSKSTSSSLQKMGPPDSNGKFLPSQAVVLPLAEWLIGFEFITTKSKLTNPKIPVQKFLTYENIQ